MRNLVRHAWWVLLVLAGAAHAGALEYGPRGGLVGLPADSYVCVAYDAPRNRCLVRAVAEAEIAQAYAAAHPESVPPGWMRARFTADEAVPSIEGLPADNEYGLPGLMTRDLDAAQVALVRCLAGTRLGRPLAEWDDPRVYQSGIVELCEQEVAAGRAEATQLPLPARFIQEAVVIVATTQRLTDANRLYSAYSGRFAGSASELIDGAMLQGVPAATPSMGRGGFAMDPDNRIVVTLKPQAGDVCRALNLIFGRAWHALPSRLPAGARSGCYRTERGYRFEHQG